MITLRSIRPSSKENRLLKRVDFAPSALRTSPAIKKPTTRGSPTIVVSRHDETLVSRATLFPQMPFQRRTHIRQAASIPLFSKGCSHSQQVRDGHKTKPFLHLLECVIER